MNELDIENNEIWALYHEEDNVMLYAFNSREEAILKLGDYEDVALLEIASISRNMEGWMVSGLSWKKVVFDLVKQTNS